MRKLWVLWSGCAVVVLLLGGCGKKAPLRSPDPQHNEYPVQYPRYG